MNELIFYSYPSCTSCRKTKHWLKAHNIDFSEKHLFRETPSYTELQKILQLTTDGMDEILATRSQTYKDLNLNIDDLPLSDVIKLIIEEPKLLRRPIITDGKKLVVGYNPQSLTKLAKKKEIHKSVS
ncbi:MULTISPECIES: Spx/MgsR family RNA polymerase-binding regulatory protein [Metabacillus]|jgi:Spx/MgsR family transcriptional regulator|uniref:Spx/MgsR family RNA polymerase-binding regulatory protein n=1 Tax=Metabacillus hrfriensis TaxID=3048891 RepID=A0ACD4R7T3_9BACI|nr:MULTISPECIES: Spx/MgsR family RNA polymerase-binding regulatory protein [Metabacillus]UAL51022.1 Spx/MgsR family RNA polymerase-binding regulatory protein [Metabacillus dongyingensis]UOK57023.1 Spx/MgsR family RNA polymerase-binding regulatory protein [Bacillus sp. OVS6]USK27300.1 Spx/MgsR family RNA polymerase-binding regulatory protein [Bacillus sp. CMF21]WHZ56523.1 Spx/MgsR family RNA polymerase-binding regulatory protein [Metabacillus sp. CT-WN-B3]